MADPWPAEVPQSLWTFNQLATEELAQVPMMGVKFASGFLYAFAFGCVFIAVFAWQRFRIRTDVQSPSRALTELGPSDIGGHSALVRAYFIYAGAILVLYVSLTFFGKLLFQMSRLVSPIGISVDTGELRFESAQWPLMLAFGFAGFSQMLAPVASVEGWLRLRAYRAVGIPVRLEQTMRNLIVTLERASSDRNLASLHIALAPYRKEWTALINTHAWASLWARNRPTGAEELVSLLSQLELLISWSRNKRGSWPGHEVSQAVRERERTYVTQASALLNDFQQRMTEKPEDDDAGKPSTRKARFNDYLVETIRSAEALRYDLVGILAIFLERDIDSPDVIARNRRDPDPGYTDPALRTLLKHTTRADSAGTGPESGLFVALIVVFLVCAAAAWRGLQDPVGQFVEKTNPYGMLISALVETLRITALTWLPLLAAFSLRQYLWDNGDWARARYSTKPDHYMPQVLTCMTLGIAVAVIGLAGVAALKAFFIAQGNEYFASLLWGSKVPFLLYYPTQAVVVVPLIPLAIRSADLRVKPQQRLVLGIVAALLVGGLSLAHAIYWNETLVADCMAAAAIVQQGCMRRVDVVGHLILMALAFLAVGVFGDLPERRRMAFRAGVNRASGLMLVPAVLLAVALAPLPARAKPPELVRIGFRVDIAPFSYQTDQQDSRSFHGYLADLCFDIFDGDPRYSVQVIPVDASNRFDLFNANKLDMLCDAVTMRFSESERSDQGIYSPIVFVSGVSYLQFRKRGFGPIWLGFVLNATARDVALKTCQVDQFQAVMPDRRAFLAERCSLRWHAALLAERLRPALTHGAPSGQPIDQDARQWAKRGNPGPEVGRDLAALRRAAEHLQRNAANADEYRLNDATRALIKVATDKESVVSRCLQGWPDSPDCLAAWRALADPRCEVNAPAPPRPDPNVRPVPFEERPWDDYAFCPMPDHRALVQWFCASAQDMRRVYLGDRELIVSKLEAWVRDNGSCPVERPDGAEFLSYEPYAFLIRQNRPGLAAHVQRRIYELFSDRPRMNQRFAGSFPDGIMSKPLAYLFLLNAVENDTTFLPATSARAETLPTGAADDAADPGPAAVPAGPSQPAR